MVNEWYYGNLGIDASGGGSEYTGYTGNPSKPSQVKCHTTQRVIDKMIERAEAGMEKFGVTMEERTEYTPIRLLREAQEEALDLAIYLEALIDKIAASEAL